MDWLNRLNAVMDYIEENLEGEIDVAHAAKLAYCSTFHFQRMFSYLANVPLSEYVRRRRMTTAALLLQSGEDKIIDLALRFGYDSPTAFNRAFQAVHGISPSAAREHGRELKAYPRITFQISIKGDAEMKYKIEQKAPFRIVGVKTHVNGDAEESMKIVPTLWGKVFQNGQFQTVAQLCNGQPCGVLGVCTEMQDKEFDYYIASTTDKPVPEDMEEYEVPAATWAIFECVGAMPKAMQDLQKRVISEWLPASGYEYADAPDIEVYFEGDTTSPQYRSEVWLPVVKKK